jgi:hypothetical protein
MPEDYNPNSPDALFSRIIARLDADAEARKEFRTQILTRLDDGTKRMDAQDQALERIEVQALKTNGRVTVLEKKWKHVAAKIATAATVLAAVGQALLWLAEKGWLRLGP